MQKKHIIICGAAVGFILLVMILKTITGSIGSISSMNDAIDAGSNITMGSFELTINSTEESDSKIVSYPAMKVSGYTDGQKAIINLAVDNDGDVYESGEVLLITDSNAYVNVNALNNFTSKVFNIKVDTIDTSKGKWVLVSNNFTEANTLAYTDAYQLFGGLVKAGFAGIEETSEDAFYVVNTEDNACIATICNNLIAYITENKDTIAASILGILNPIELDCKTQLYKKLTNSSANLTETEYIGKFIDNFISELTTIAKNSETTEKKQIASCTTSYCIGEEGSDVFSENLSFKYDDSTKIKGYNVSFMLTKNPNVTVNDLSTEQISNEKANVSSINSICKELINYDLSQLLKLDSTEQNTSEFDVKIKDDLITCLREDDTCKRKVLYITNNDEVIEAVAIVSSKNTAVNNSFDEFYAKKGYTKTIVKYPTETINIPDIDNQIIDVVKAMLDSSQVDCHIYIATKPTLDEINDSITTIDNFVLSLKG